ncbi:unnamed protein product, partial [Ascophyllum nodosum]
CRRFQSLTYRSPSPARKPRTFSFTDPGERLDEEVPMVSSAAEKANAANGDANG